MLTAGGKKIYPRSCVRCVRGRVLACGVCGYGGGVHGRWRWTGVQDGIFPSDGTQQVMGVEKVRLWRWGFYFFLWVGGGLTCGSGEPC